MSKDILPPNTPPLVTFIYEATGLQTIHEFFPSELKRPPKGSEIPLGAGRGHLLSTPFHQWPHKKGIQAVNHLAPKVYQSKMPRQPAGAAGRRVATSTRSARDLASRTPREVAHTRSCRFILRRGETRRPVSPRRRSVPGHPVSAGSVSR